MGYTYIQCDLVYGVIIKKNGEDLNDFLENPYEGMFSSDQSEYMEEEEKLAKVLGLEYLCEIAFNKKYEKKTNGIFLHRFGFDAGRGGDREGGVVLGIGKIFTSGNIWKQESLDTQYMHNLEQDTQVNHKLKTFLEKLGFKDQEPKWLNLLKVF